jgi:GAF domain-containing protein
MLKEGKDGRLAAKALRVLKPGLKNLNLQVSQSILNTALDKNQALLISDIQSDAQFRVQESVIRAKIYSAMCVPLWNNQEIIGIIYADRTHGLKRFTEDDLKL